MLHSQLIVGLLCAYMYFLHLHMHTHTHTHTCIHTYARTYTHTHAHTYTRTYSHTCTYVYMHAGSRSVNIVRHMMVDHVASLSDNKPPGWPHFEPLQWVTPVIRTPLIKLKISPINGPEGGGIAIRGIFNYAAYIYRSVLGKHPWALKHNSRFRPAWVLTRDINSICLYGSCNNDPLKFGTWALTWEWALARDTTVLTKGL